MQWYRKLYVGEGIKSKGSVVRKIRTGAGQIGIFVITLASNPRDLLDIMDSIYLMQPWYHKNKDLMIVGIARGYGEAVELAVQILECVYADTGAFGVRDYIMEQQHRGIAGKWRK